MADTATQPDRIIDIDALAWAEMIPGVQAKRVWADPEGGRVALFIRFAAGASLPRHTHQGDELVYVLEGSVADDSGIVTAGCVGYRPDGCTHTVSSPRGGTAFAVITGGTAPVAGDGAGAGPPSLVFDLPTADWIEVAPGVRQKRFWSDPAAGRVAALARFEPGASLPAHRHVGDELVFVLEGTIDDEAGPVRPGQLGYRPNGCTHAVSSPHGATAIAYLWGGVEPV